MDLSECVCGRGSAFNESQGICGRILWSLEMPTLFEAGGPPKRQRALKFIIFVHLFPYKPPPANIVMMQLTKACSTVRSARYPASKVAKPTSATRSSIVPRASPSPPEDTNAGPAPPPGTIFYGELLFATHCIRFYRFIRRASLDRAS